MRHLRMTVWSRNPLGGDCAHGRGLHCRRRCIRRVPLARCKVPAARQKRACGVVLASGRESADHQLVDAHLFLCSFDGESAVQAFAHA